MATIDSTPYEWPYNGDLRPDNTALIVIDNFRDDAKRCRSAIETKSYKDCYINGRHQNDLQHTEDE